MWVYVGDLSDYKLWEVWKCVDPETVRMKGAGRDSPPTTAGSGSQ
jgi:hypothetical protein